MIKYEKIEVYENNKNLKIAMIKNKHGNIAQYNVTNYDFNLDDFKEFIKKENISKEDLFLYQEKYNLNSDLGAYLLIYLGY